MRRPSGITDRGELRKLARAILDERVSASTLAEYGRIEKRLAGMHWHDYAIEHQLKHVGPIRAAWRRRTAKQVLIELAKSEDRMLTADERTTARALAVKLVEQLAEVITYIRPPRPRASKRDGQCDLPDDWREKLLMAMPEKHRISFMVMALTGSRPEEMRKGVSIRVLQSDLLEFEIQGAKCSSATGGGQDWRRLVVDPSVSLPNFGQVLSSGVSDLGGVATLPPITGLGLQKAITRVARDKLGYPNISAYNLRHAFASDLKANKAAGDAISKSLGHVSRRSKDRYGRSQSGKSGRSALVSVEAARALTGEDKIPPWISRLLEQHRDTDPDEED
jgi:hypothetical protein